MSEQSGRDESADRRGSEQRRPSPAGDMLSDLQRWLLRSSARNMRRELSGQVRRTLGGGRQAGSSDVWDTATHEIPPEVGESPECQWCPICRAARHMRESGPGLGGQISGAGDAVASVVQDAISALDSILSRAGGSGERRTGAGERQGGDGERRTGVGERQTGGGERPAGSGGERRTGAGERSSGGDGKPRAASSSGPDAAGEDAGSAGDAAAARDAHARRNGSQDLPGSVAGDHGPGGWKPGDRLATEHVVDPDPWAGATAHDDSAEDGGQGAGESAQPAADAGPAPLKPDSAQLDGQGHEPDDRG